MNYKYMFTRMNLNFYIGKGTERIYVQKVCFQQYGQASTFRVGCRWVEENEIHRYWTSVILF